MSKVKSTGSAAASSRRGAPTRATVEAWIPLALKQLSLGLWRIQLSEDLSDQDAWADIEAHTQAYTATLRLSPDFWKQDPDKQRAILTHELLHLATQPYDRIVQNLEEPLGKVAWSVLEPQIEDASERVVDYFAQLLAEHMPPLE